MSEQAGGYLSHETVQRDLQEALLFTSKTRIEAADITKLELKGGEILVYKGDGDTDLASIANLVKAATGSPCGGIIRLSENETIEVLSDAMLKQFGLQRVAKAEAK